MAGLDGSVFASVLLLLALVGGILVRRSLKAPKAVDPEAREAEVRAANRYRGFFENPLAGCMETSLDGVVLAVNRTECSLRKLPPESIIGKCVWDLDDDVGVGVPAPQVPQPDGPPADVDASGLRERSIRRVDDHGRQVVGEGPELGHGLGADAIAVLQEAWTAALVAPDRRRPEGVVTEGMVVVPCTMGSLAAIAQGYSRNLIHRAADVCLKERRRLVLVPREMPLSRIHLHNMLQVVDAGGIVLPPVPGFYHLPQTVQDLVDFRKPLPFNWRDRDLIQFRQDIRSRDSRERSRRWSQSRRGRGRRGWGWGGRRGWRIRRSWGWSG